MDTEQMLADIDVEIASSRLLLEKLDVAEPVSDAARLRGQEYRQRIVAGIVRLQRLREIVLQEAA